MNRNILVYSTAVFLGACSAPPMSPLKVDDGIVGELKNAAEQRPKQAQDAKVNEALLPPLKAEIPPVSGQPIEPRFDLAVNNAPAQQVFTSIVSGTRYSILVPPDVTGAISVNLKDVTVPEALDAIRETYGYEYRISGARIYVQSASIQTRVFQVNYLIGQRRGQSDVRVTSGSVSDAPVSNIPGAPAAPVPVAPGPGGGLSSITDSSRIQTQTKNDFWEDLRLTLQALIGDGAGRGVVVNPQAGVVVVRALPREIRTVEAYLKAIRLSVQRQVMLEAKIVEVTLSEQYQTGINWAAFPTNGISAGPVSAGTLLQSSNAGSALVTGATGLAGSLAGSGVTTTGAAVGAAAGQSLINFTNPAASLFGVAFQSKNFAALLTFLESQGGVQVLSSPRIATLNNQKAVLKVGSDEFFITSISGGTATSGTQTTTTTGTTSFPTLTLRPFFSGVAFDITPQIDENSNIILHVHPSVSDVQEDDRVINLGTVFGGPVTLPLAKSTVSETDSVVKVSDGNIVAIGGLMKVDINDTKSGIPGAQDLPGIGGLFGSRNRTTVKKELVILIKPTVVQSDNDLHDDIAPSIDRLLNMMPQASGGK